MRIMTRYIFIFSFFLLTDNVFSQEATEFGIVTDLTVFGTNSTLTDPNVEIKGFTVFGSTQDAYPGEILNAPGNVVINGYLSVSSGSYFAGISTFPAAGNIYIKDGTAGYVLRKSTTTGVLEWVDPSTNGDSLGNHIATMTLTAGYGINVSSLNITGTGVSGSNPLFKVAGSTMVVLNNGNVGIGTTNPGAKLDVAGIIMGGGGYANIDPNGSIDDTLFNNLKNTAKFAIGWNRSAGGGETDFISNRGGGGTGGFRFYDLANDGTLSSALVTIQGGGNVGIGTTSPSYRLVVSSGAGESGNMLVISTGISEVIRMTGAGEIYANKFYGDGSNLSGVVASGIADNAITSAKIADGSIMDIDINSAAGIVYSKLNIADGDLTIAKTNGLQTQLNNIATSTNSLQTQINTLSNSTTTLDNNKVPYTGATALVNLGSYGINASSINITGTGVSGSNPLFKVAGSTMVVLNNGNVGIGTTNPHTKLEIGAQDGANEGGEIRWAGAGTNRYFYLDNHAGRLRYVSQDASGESEKITILNTGNVGIGTTSPLSKLDVYGDVYLYAKNALKGSDSWLRLNNDKSFTSGVHTPGLFAPVSLNVGGVSSWGDPGSGNVWVNGTMSLGTSNLSWAGKTPKILAYSGGGPAIITYVNTTNDANQIVFNNPNGEMGWINTNSNGTSYGSTSDRRLKDKIDDITDQESDLFFSKVRPRKWVWKNSAEKGIGFIAQELVEFFPDVVIKGDDNPNLKPGDEGYKPWGVDYGKLTPYLAAEIRLLRNKIKQLDTELETENTKIENQHKEIELLEKENKELKTRLDNLESKIK
jgi:prefoldin subunit 5